ncbi:MAG: TatD family hydrolase [Helicobacteraceae bacterium]|jgi:TatD DNase family protein|nr:TatD family hydrolase [Helicobacteraceae bacterium]
MIIDTHVHLDRRDYDDDLDDAIARAEAIGVQGFIVPAADPKDLPKARAIALSRPNVFFAAGAHPHHADEFNESAIKSVLDDPKCVAIGECGLDYFRLPKDPEKAEAIKATQNEVFKRHIAIANDRKLPLIVHIRDAAIDALDALQSAETGGVLHCFTGDERLLGLGERGFYFGIGGVLTFANAKELESAVVRTPLEQIVLETDAPYLAPVPHRGRRNESAFLEFVVQKLAEIKALPTETIIRETTRNAVDCFGLKPFLGKITI